MESDLFRNDHFQGSIDSVNYLHEMDKIFFSNSYEMSSLDWNKVHRFVDEAVQPLAVNPASNSSSLDFRPTGTPSFDIFGNNGLLRTSYIGYTVPFTRGWVFHSNADWQFGISVKY
jgi:hypothetical protein